MNLRVVKQWRPELERYRYTIEDVDISADPRIHPFVLHLPDGLLAGNSMAELAATIDQVRAAVSLPVLHLKETRDWIEESRT